jgi:hypothetical protein
MYGAITNGSRMKPIRMNMVSIPIKTPIAAIIMITMYVAMYFPQPMVA